MPDDTHTLLLRDVPIPVRLRPITAEIQAIRAAMQRDNAVLSFRGATQIAILHTPDYCRRVDWTAARWVVDTSIINNKETAQ